MMKLTLFVLLKLLDKITIDKIKLVNVTDEYLIPLNRIFNLYNIPINLNNGKSIYGTQTVRSFLNKLKEYNSIQLALDEIENNEIKDLIINICNKYTFKDLDNTII